MTKWPLWLLSKVGTVVLVGYIAWMGWQYLGPRKPEVGPVRKALADDLVSLIAEDVRTGRQAVRQAVCCTSRTIRPTTSRTNFVA